MDIIIRDALNASRFKPTVPTLAMRIYGSSPKEKAEFENYGLLSDSGLWLPDRRGLQYVFDDLDPEESEISEEAEWARKEGYTLFDESIAKKIINDFASYRNALKALLVHCTYGHSRSPAVAFALRDIFRLDGDIHGEYPCINSYVYKTMLKKLL
jgi:hypothetical protein